MKTAKEIAIICKTTKEARAMFKELCETMKREEAQKLIKSACELINKANETARNENKIARNWLKDYDNILNMENEGEKMLTESVVEGLGDECE